MAAVLNRKQEKSADDLYSGEELPLTVQPKKNEVFEKPIPASTKFGYKPVHLTCPHCHLNTKTNLAFHITDRTHLAVLACSLVTWPCGVCFLAGVPYCLNCCQKVDHHCSDCNAIVGHHSRC